MIIQIDGLEEEIFLTGKKYNVRVLREMYRKTMAQTYEMKDFPFIFCRLYQYDLITDWEDLEPDVVMDVDTDMVYRPG